MARKTILIVDEDRVVLSLVGVVLEKLGHAVLKSRDSEEALVLFEAHRPLELAILDVRLKRMDGFELGAAMRSVQPGLKILFISGSISDATALQAERQNPPNHFFLHKPFLPKQLSETIGIMLLTGSA